MATYPELTPDANGRVYNIRSAKGGPIIGQIFACKGVGSYPYDQENVMYWFWASGQTPWPSSFHIEWVDYIPAAPPYPTESESRWKNTTLPPAPMTAHTTSTSPYKMTRIYSGSPQTVGYLDRVTGTGARLKWHALKRTTAGYLPMGSDKYLTFDRVTSPVSDDFYYLEDYAI